MFCHSNLSRKGFSSNRATSCLSSDRAHEEEGAQAQILLHLCWVFYRQNLNKILKNWKSRKEKKREKIFGSQVMIFLIQVLGWTAVKWTIFDLFWPTKVAVLYGIDEFSEKGSVSPWTKLIGICLTGKALQEVRVVSFHFFTHEVWLYGISLLESTQNDHLFCCDF